VPTTSAGPAIRMSGAGAGETATVTIADSRLAQRFGDYGFALVQLWLASTVTVADSALTPIGEIAQVRNGARLALDRVATTGPGGGGIAVDPGGELTVDRSRLAADWTVLRAESQFGTARATVRDSLLITDATLPFTPAIAVRASQRDEALAEVVLEGSTVVSRGPSALLAQLDALDRGSALLNSRGSALRAFDTATQQPGRTVRAEGSRAGRAVFTAAHSFFGETVALDNAAVAAPGSPTNVAGDPRFADEAGGDYLPAPGSPLVDAGDPAGAARPLDLAGGPRSLDGDGRCGAVPDVGALERPALPDAGCPGGGDNGDGGDGRGGDGSGDDGSRPAVPPRLDRVRLDRARIAPGARRPAGVPRSTRLRWRLSAPATLTIALQRASAGRRAGARCLPRRRRGASCTRWTAVATQTVRAGAGAGSAAVTGRVRGRALAPGTYRLRLVPRNAGGRGAARTVALRVVTGRARTR